MPAGRAERWRVEILDALARTGSLAPPEDPVAALVARQLVHDGAARRRNGLLRPAGQPGEPAGMAPQLQRAEAAIAAAHPPLVTVAELSAASGLDRGTLAQLVGQHRLEPVGELITTRQQLGALRQHRA